MRIFSKLLLLSVFALAAHTTISAQWPIGEPVSMELSTLTMYSLDVCPPTPTHRFWFPISEAAGIDHIAIVETLDTPDIVEIGSDNPVSVGDTIPITSTDLINVYFFAGSGLMTLKFYATGTPTEVGDPIPCEANDLWITTLPICNITNNPIFSVDGDCVVIEPKPSSIDGFESLGVSISWPNATNGYQLRINSQNDLTSAEVRDLSGRAVANKSSNIIDCQQLKAGVYIFTVHVGDEVVTQSFVLTR